MLKLNILYNKVKPVRRPGGDCRDFRPPHFKISWKKSKKVKKVNFQTRRGLLMYLII
jgi:hypothetical protein